MPVPAFRLTPSSSLRLAARIPALLLAATLAAAPIAAISSPARAGAVSFDALRGWHADRQAQALAAFQRSCRSLRGKPASHPMGRHGGSYRHWQLACAAALEYPADVADADARRFFEFYFRPVAVTENGRAQGLFTGYFEPELEGSLRRSATYNVPIYARPPDLVAFSRATRRHPSAKGLAAGRMVNGVGHPYFTREQIERGALAGRARVLLYLKDKVDAFFLHVQGSGRVRLDTGEVVRVAFAAKTGLPYTPIGAVLVKRGEIPAADISMQSIADWLRRHPRQADALMWHNRSYIFFRLAEVGDPALGPAGAAGVPLTPGRSLAVDRRIHGYGTPMWLDTSAPLGPGGSEQPVRRLVIAQDTGTAIVGAVRGDVFWGSGDRAAAVAGPMKSPGRMYALVPVELARRSALEPPP